MGGHLLVSTKENMYVFIGNITKQPINDANFKSYISKC